MKIDGITTLGLGGRRRYSARLRWEERARDETLWYEWSTRFAEEVTPTPAAALVAALPLALVTGERRVAIEGRVCPQLLDHLRTAVQRFRVWYPDVPATEVEAEREWAAAPPPKRRAAICLSGGVDSLAALVDNHGALAVGHPERFTDGLYVSGLNTFDFHRGEPVPERVAWYERYGARLDAFAERAGLTVVAVRTNVRSLSFRLV